MNCKIFKTALLGCALALALLPGCAEAKYQVLHSFAGGFDGSTPEADLFIDANDVVYGTTPSGGIDALSRTRHRPQIAGASS